jgi:type VI protein secretion system component Hcp
MSADDKETGTENLEDLEPSEDDAAEVKGGKVSVHDISITKSHDQATP